MNSSMSPTPAAGDERQKSFSGTPNGQPLDENLNGSGMEGPYELICVGFGPASLAVAVALRDLGIQARVMFLERQRQFAWHSGMLLPTARMQISFLKDLATFRNPRSPFTFLNYLKAKNRLEPFTNLGTFLPLREEFNDYFTWAAGHFDHCVRYGSEVLSISPESKGKEPVSSWKILSRDTKTSETIPFTAKNVIIAAGGTPRLPKALQNVGPQVVHSSQYLAAIPKLLPENKENLRLAVIGGGQSSAEIFDDLSSNFPEAKISLYCTGTALKPSDDSPFVNEIFDPDQVSEFYSLPPSARHSTLSEHRSTNYSVVRPELLDQLYQKQYQQRLRKPDPATWNHRIVGLHELIGARAVPATSPEGNYVPIGDLPGHPNGQNASKNGGLDGSTSSKIELQFRNPRTGATTIEGGWDLVIVGTGYVRNAHERMLGPTMGLLEDGAVGEQHHAGCLSVTRDYRLRTKPGAVAEGCGIWVQGCCEESHGLSDTLLSILAVRSGELVTSIFGSSAGSQSGRQPANGTIEGVGAQKPTVDGKAATNGVMNEDGPLRNGY